jgi:hypothetical protein
MISFSVKTGWGDRLFAAGLGLVMAITLIFFVMAIPGRMFGAAIAIAGAGSQTILSQWNVALLLSAASGVAVGMLFLPPRTTAAPQAAAPIAPEPSPQPAFEIEEGILDLLDDPAPPAEPEPGFFLDLAAIREAAAMR